MIFVAGRGPSLWTWHKFHQQTQIAYAFEMKQIQRKTSVFVAGGSTGLGKAIAMKLAASGANVTIFSRNQFHLDQTAACMRQVAAKPDQEIRAVSVDLADAKQVQQVFQSQPQLPDIMYCVAGGCATEMGFFTDLSARDMEQCMQRNYFTSLYPTHTLLRLWRDDDCVSYTTLVGQRLRQIVFVCSAAAFANVPGYIAYTLMSPSAAKVAQRALADTLRQEAAIYSNLVSKYSIHCAFPATIVTETFFKEQLNKPELTKAIESTCGTAEELRAKHPSAEVVAERIIAGVDCGDFAICTDFETAVLWSSMMGPSPKRGWGFVDSTLAVVSGLFVWPFLRQSWNALCHQTRNDASPKPN